MQGSAGKSALRRPVAATVVLLTVAIGWQAWGGMNERAHLAPAVERALSAHDQANLDVVVKFPPEKFHLLYFQERGRVVGVEGVVVHMEAVPARSVHDMARQYWIVEVRLRDQ